MKVGILTFHNVPNFGAFLQAYALKQVVESLGHEVQIIDLTLTPQRTFIGKIVEKINDVSFEKYRRTHFRLTDSFNSFETKYDFGFDLYIVGSDQVWNKSISKNNYLNYFFDFLPETSRRISYAASFGQKDWPFNKNETDEVKVLLKKFQDIAVREVNGKDLLLETLHIESTLVLDPTLLLYNYDNLISKNHTSNNKVTCFKFKRDQEFYDFTVKFKAKEKLKIRELRGIKPFKGTSIVPFPSIGDWLYYIKTAPYVITDSFHGVCFSIIFQKNFIVIPADIKKFNRIENLLAKLGLSERIFYSYSEILEDDRWKMVIDYSVVNKKLDILRKDSMDYLKRWL